LSDSGSASEQSQVFSFQVIFSELFLDKNDFIDHATTSDHPPGSVEVFVIEDIVRVDRALISYLNVIQADNDSLQTLGGQAPESGNLGLIVFV